VQTEHYKNSRYIVAGVLTTISSIYPTFLAGALGNTLKTDLGIGDQYFGILTGCFFIGAMTGSVFLSKFVETFGARKSILLGLSITIVVNLFLASIARSGLAFIFALSIAGLANATNQPAVNKLFSKSISKEKLGFAMSAKQSGMPAGAMLGGLAVPAFALTIGWQWAYVAAGCIATIAWINIYFLQDSSESIASKNPPGKMSSKKSYLVLAAVGGAMASTGSGTLTSWLTSSAEDTGISPKSAGLLLSLSAFVGICVRLSSGWAADKYPNLRPLRVAGLLLFLGGIGTVLLGPRISGIHIVAGVVAIGLGWSWPALFNIGVVKANIEAASAATGITQTGVYFGVFFGPTLMGFLVENYSYQIGWLAIGLIMICGAFVMNYAGNKIATV